MLNVYNYSCVIIFILLLILNFQYVNSKNVRCIGYDGKTNVDWWFILSKQTSKEPQSSVGGGYIYVDSNDVVVDMDHDLKGTFQGSEDKLKAVSIKILIERHITVAQNDNQEVFDECTKGGYKLSSNYLKARCQNKINAFFNAQTYYHDTVEQQDNEMAARKRENSRKESHTKTEDEKDEIYENIITKIDEEDVGGLSYGEEKATATKSLFKDTKGVTKAKYLTVIKPADYAPKPNSFRNAHSKFLVSVNTVTGNGYIIDHSANFPSVAPKAEGFYIPFVLQELFVKDVRKEFSDGTKGKNQGSQGKFVFSHHFFCFNFASAEFNGLMDTIKNINPRFVKSNYVGRHDDEDKYLIADTYNVKKKLEGYAGENRCSNYYHSLYQRIIRNKENNEIIDTNLLVSETLSNTKFSDLNNVCFKKSMLTGNSLFVYGFKSRNRPNGFNDQLNDQVSKREDNYKLYGNHLTYTSYGIDPFTYLAKAFGGAFYVSTLPQSKRVEIPSIRTDTFSIYVLKSWKSGGAPSAKRHEKLLFGVSEDNDIVCVGDGNRNLIHSLYAGLAICFRSEKLVEKLKTKVDSASTFNMFTSGNDNKFELAIKQEKKSDAYPPGFIQSLLKPGEDAVLDVEEDSESGSEGDSAGSESYNSDSEEEFSKKRRKTTKKIPKNKYTKKTPTKKTVPVKEKKRGGIPPIGESAKHKRKRSVSTSKSETEPKTKKSRGTG